MRKLFPTNVIWIAAALLLCTLSIALLFRLGMDEQPVVRSSEAPHAAPSVAVSVSDTDQGGAVRKLVPSSAIKPNPVVSSMPSISPYNSLPSPSISSPATAVKRKGKTPFDQLETVPSPVEGGGTIIRLDDSYFVE